MESQKAYLEYLQKEALGLPEAGTIPALFGTAVQGADTGVKAVQGMATYVLALTALSGGLAGAAISRATSPSRLSTSNEQKDFLRNKLETEIARSRRELMDMQSARRRKQQPQPRGTMRI